MKVAGLLCCVYAKLACWEQLETCGLRVCMRMQRKYDCAFESPRLQELLWPLFQVRSGAGQELCCPPIVFILMEIRYT